MAGTWIKMRTNLRDDPRVSRIAENLEKDRLFIIGCLFELWSMADEHSREGMLKGLTATILDKQVGIVGFSKQLELIGWIEFSEEGATIPRFDEHNGGSAKRRAEEAARKAKARRRAEEKEKKRTRDTVSSGAKVDGKSLADGVKPG
jgi:hypothetical protein